MSLLASSVHCVCNTYNRSTLERMYYGILAKAVCQGLLYHQYIPKGVLYVRNLIPSPWKQCSTRSLKPAKAWFSL